MSKLVMIHGLNWKPPKAKLEERYARHLAEGVGGPLPAGMPRVAYWADVVGHDPTESDNDDYKEPRGSFLPLQGRDEKVAELRGRSRRFGTRALGRVFGRFIERPESDEEAAISLLAGETLDLVSRPLYAKLLRDIDRYLRGGVRDRVKGLLVAELQSAPAGRACLIAHSMGSMIAADVLASTDHRVDLLLTIGSPLGISTVRRQLGLEEPAARDRLRRNVGKWVNLYDPLDKVALDHDLKDDFREMGISDVEVQNDFVAINGEHDHHKSYGYLRTPELGGLVRRFLSDGTS